MSDHNFTKNIIAIIDISANQLQAMNLGLDKTRNAVEDQQFQAIL